MSTRPFSLLLFSSLAMLHSAFAAAPRPNVLFLAADDLRPELGAYGANHIHSPNMDRLAKHGITFDRAYCQQAICSPSRTSLLTGARPDTTKVWDLETHFRKTLPDAVTLPQLFKQHGYFVQGLGKLFHGGLDDPSSWSVPSTQPRINPSAYMLPENQAIVAAKSNAAKNATKNASSEMTWRFGPPFECADVSDDTYFDGQLATMAVQALRECAKHDRPFWLGVGFLRPHLPFIAPKKYWDLYDPAKIQLAPNPSKARGAPSYATGLAGEAGSYHGVPRGAVPDDLARQLRHGYFAAISYVDALVGRVLDELDRLGLTQKTIIVLWGDHGWKLGEHGGWAKHSNVENDTRSPLIVSVPGLDETAGKHTDALVEFVDIYPSVAELCGLPRPSHLEGTSFAPLLKEPARPWKSAAFSQYPRSGNMTGGKDLMGYSMRTDRYRLTRWLYRPDHTRVDAVELYDHQTDPQENVNIAGDPKNAALLARLMVQWNQGWRGATPPAR